MNENENNENENEIQKGIFTISDVEKYNIAKILELKQTYMLNFSSNSNDFESLKKALLDLTSAMQLILEKYLKTENNVKQYTTITINSRQVNFYQLKAFLYDAVDVEELRFLFEKISFIFDSFVRDVLKISFATEKKEVKKK